MTRIFRKRDLVQLTCVGTGQFASSDQLSELATQRHLRGTDNASAPSSWPLLIITRWSATALTANPQALHDRLLLNLTCFNILCQLGAFLDQLLKFSFQDLFRFRGCLTRLFRRAILLYCLKFFTPLNNPL